MKNIQNLTIDVNKKPFQIITANVGEVASRFIKITMLDNNIPVNLTGVNIYLYIQKADGTKVFNSVKKEDENNGVILAELTSQALSVEGVAKLTLLLVKDGAKLYSKQFLLNIDSSIVDDEAIESTNEFTALVDALGSVNNIDSKFEGVSSQLKHIENNTSRIINIDNFNDIQEAIDYAKKHNKKITGDKITLDRNVSFRGVELDVNILDIKGYSVELGGYYTPDVEGQAKTNPPQRINKILRDTDTPNGEEQVFIRGSVGQFITIGQYYGSVNFRMNETDTHNAYSTYTFGYVWKITIDNDTWASSSPSVNLWMNENIFHINRCNHFIMKGTFPHDLNRIYGGCFEQKSSIEIYAGRHNYFYDMRFEGRKSVNIIFAEGTIGNVIYRNDLYYINIVDNGRQNAVIYKEQNNYRLINNYSIKADTFNTSYLNGFKNLIPTSDRLGFKPTSDGQIEILETEFIPNPKNAMFTATCSRKVGNGLAVKYKIYDSNFKEITNLSSKQFFMVTTNESSMTNFQEGNYRSPGDQSANSKDCTNGVFNDVVTLYPTSYFVSDGSNIKYVKFFIISSSYFNPDAEYYDMSASIYNIAGNYNRYYIL